jgi:hypothetical protein
MPGNSRLTSELLALKAASSVNATQKPSIGPAILLVALFIPDACTLAMTRQKMKILVIANPEVWLEFTVCCLLA